MKNIIVFLIIFLTFIPSYSQKQKTIRIVSFPDFLNFDIPEPWHGYDSAIAYFLNHVKKEKPDFILVAGDLVNGHWWDGPKCIEHMGSIYYSGWIRRMEKYGLKYYTAIGDHELGDDPWPQEKIKLIPHFENVYKKYLKMPENGPENKKGLAYYVKYNNLLVITLETFEVINDTMHVDVCCEQLKWLEKVLEENKNIKFKIVQGHAPIWGEIKGRSTSNLMIEKRKESELYKTLKKYNVDLYLCGEFHDVTVLESDGIWQIVHGSSWGREIVNTQDYLVIEVKENEMNLSLKRIYIDSKGDYMWNLHKDKGPREIVNINEKSLRNGPEITGTLTIKYENNKKVYLNQTGYFK